MPSPSPAWLLILMDYGFVHVHSRTVLLNLLYQLTLYLCMIMVQWEYQAYTTGSISMSQVLLGMEQFCPLFHSTHVASFSFVSNHICSKLHVRQRQIITLERPAMHFLELFSKISTVYSRNKEISCMYEALQAHWL